MEAAGAAAGLALAALLLVLLVRSGQPAEQSTAPAAEVDAGEWVTTVAR